VGVAGQRDREEQHRVAESLHPIVERIKGVGPEQGLRVVRAPAVDLDRDLDRVGPALAYLVLGLPEQLALSPRPRLAVDDQRRVPSRLVVGGRAKVLEAAPALSLLA